jgi:hypothetical protein
VRHNGGVRRSLAGVLFGIAFACACVSISGFLLERTAFSPANTFDSADVVLDDDVVRAELVRTVATATVAQMSGGDAGQAAVINSNIELVASTTAGSEILAQVLRDSHARLVGQSDLPVQITPAQLVEVTRDERAAVLPAVTIDVPRVAALAAADDVLDWLVPISGLTAIVLLLLCLLAHPERPALVRSLGIGLMVLAGLTVAFGWLVPAFVPPLLSDNPWARIPSSLAAGTMPIVLGLALLLAGLGLGLFALASRLGHRRRWSTPVSTYRYRDERTWS